LSLYARGMTVREIQGHLAELYGTEVSPDLISRVTDAVLDEVREWQNRPLDRVYPVVFFDALRVKIRDEGLVKNKAVYVGNELVLYVLDANEKPIHVDSSSAKGQVLLGGKTYNVDFKPAGTNTLKASGEFNATKGMRVIVKTDKVGGHSFQARLAPLN
jgi:Transposase, Mutator family